MDNKDMPQDTLSFLQRLHEYGPIYFWWIFLACFAGTAKYLGGLRGEKPSFFGWLSETIICAFVGVVTALTCQYYALDFYMTSAIVAISAHNGTRSLYVISDMLKKNIKAPINQPPTSKSVLSRKKDK